MRHNSENCASCAQLQKLTDERFLAFFTICMNDELIRRFPKIAGLDAELDRTDSADIASLQARLADAIGHKRDS